MWLSLVYQMAPRGSDAPPSRHTRSGRHRRRSATRTTDVRAAGTDREQACECAEFGVLLDCPRHRGESGEHWSEDVVRPMKKPSLELPPNLKPSLEKLRGSYAHRPRSQPNGSNLARRQPDVPTRERQPIADEHDDGTGDDEGPRSVG